MNEYIPFVTVALIAVIGLILGIVALTKKENISKKDFSDLYTKVSNNSSEIASIKTDIEEIKDIITPEESSYIPGYRHLGEDKYIIQADPDNSVPVDGVTLEEECKSVCDGDETCTGFTWYGDDPKNVGSDGEKFINKCFLSTAEECDGRISDRYKPKSFCKELE